MPCKCKEQIKKPLKQEESLESAIERISKKIQEIEEKFSNKKNTQDKESFLNFKDVK